VPKDDVQAANWYHKAAVKADSVAAFDAQFKLGEAYQRGHGVPQDYIEAGYWYRRASDHGITKAQRKLGELFVTGRGVSQDFGEAVFWFRKAAEKSDADAQYYLGSMYSSGEGVKQNYGLAYYWADLAVLGKLGDVQPEKAIELRNTTASHLDGANLQQEQDQAQKWFMDHPTEADTQ
jgi:hypothetical protein